MSLRVTGFAQSNTYLESTRAAKRCFRYRLRENLVQESKIDICEAAKDRRVCHLLKQGSERVLTKQSISQCKVDDQSVRNVQD